ncbi:uncharacterized protein LOC125543057 isoform X2 [Triticum urartu]|uniref:uncharacterized protein LOC125543057 isoform X2 n=1 Tax=Triticum urartu TaxID=4572 RepID=UPI002044966D|nr:uncharacterized protein LOC125543057 isoform X2 [Triticum urartu]
MEVATSRGHVQHEGGWTDCKKKSSVLQTAPAAHTDYFLLSSSRKEDKRAKYLFGKLQPNPGTPDSSSLHLACDQLHRLYKLLGNDLVVAGIPLQRQNPGAPRRRS